MPIDIEDELKKSFISYAMAVIVSRALPDVRDGLKPVHRRILYSMVELGVTPDKPYRKSARIVGDCLGKYHPHGDSSVYDAMVRLAQDFSTRYMLVDGQGNFGSVDGDGAAAMRYTEAKLTRLAMEMVSDIEKETVDFYPNFDETLMQPAVMPSRFPNLLVNGSSGIAVGMATNIPPHNLGEVIDGAAYMLDHPDCDVPDLMQFIKGPDFPTGGIILGTRGIYEAYTTGRGRIITRAKSEIEEMGANRLRIVVTEIPYMVNKARLVEKIAELVHDKRVDGISDIRDESDRNGMRVVIELKRDVNAGVVLNTLYKHTQMQETFGVNMLALVDGEPKVLSLRQALHHYIDHQIDVITRRTRYDLDKAEARAHILEGLLIALDRIDEVISLIRASRTDQDAKLGLMETFGLTEKQAIAILDMRMRRLTGLERDKIQAEYDELLEKIAYYKDVLANDWMVRDIIKTELAEIRRKYADPRRTEITALDGDIDMLDLVQEEDMVVTLTHYGYVKRLPKATYRAQKRGGRGVMGASTREEDFVEQMYVTSTHDPLMFFTNRGRVYQLTCYEIPEAGRTARGTAMVNLLDLDAGEKVKAMLPIPAEKVPGHYLVMATRNGVIKRTELSDFVNMRKTGLIALILREDDDLIGVSLTDGNREIFLGTRNGMAIRFPEGDVRSMGRAATGVKSIDLAPGDEVVAMSTLEDGAQVLSLTENGYGKRTQIEEYRVQSRAGKGIKAMNLTDKTGLLAGQLLVHEDEDLLMITDDGTVIRTPVSSISVQGRNTQGVRLMRVGDGARVVCVARAEPEDDEDDEDEADANGEVDAADGAGAADEANDQVPDALGRLVRDLEENPEP
ncbi:MAG: DNA gyrase subunit A [Christensenellaceae bacterium]|nr:DNA gyrase subunit A [Christensenellaceae bacterium]MEA5069622.1 DNA gyrase subunit A [Christensenellaceae bacterium]